MFKHKSEYYAYANDSEEEEEIMQLEYEKECMKNYPLTWELDSTTGVRVKTHNEGSHNEGSHNEGSHNKGCQPPAKSKKIQSTTNIWAHFKQKKIKCD
jgi:hypothetical protein